MVTPPKSSSVLPPSGTREGGVHTDAWAATAEKTINEANAILSRRFIGFAGFLVNDTELICVDSVSYATNAIPNNHAKLFVFLLVIGYLHNI